MVGYGGESLIRTNFNSTGEEWERESTNRFVCKWSHHSILCCTIFTVYWPYYFVQLENHSQDNVWLCRISPHIDCHIGWIDFCKGPYRFLFTTEWLRLQWMCVCVCKSECIWNKKNLMVICIPNVTWRWHVTYYICRHAKPAQMQRQRHRHRFRHTYIWQLKPKNLLLKLNFSNARLFVWENRRKFAEWRMIAEHTNNHNMTQSIQLCTFWNEQTNRFRCREKKTSGHWYVERWQVQVQAHTHPEASERTLAQSATRSSCK